MLAALSVFLQRAAESRGDGTPQGRQRLICHPVSKGPVCLSSRGQTSSLPQEALPQEEGQPTNGASAISRQAGTLRELAAWPRHRSQAGTAGCCDHPRHVALPWSRNPVVERSVQCLLVTPSPGSGVPGPELAFSCAGAGCQAAVRPRSCAVSLSREPSRPVSQHPPVRPEAGAGVGRLPEVSLQVLRRKTAEHFHGKRTAGGQAPGPPPLPLFCTAFCIPSAF